MSLTLDISHYLYFVYIKTSRKKKKKNRILSSHDAPKEIPFPSRGHFSNNLEKKKRESETSRAMLPPPGARVPTKSHNPPSYWKSDRTVAPPGHRARTRASFSGPAKKVHPACNAGDFFLHYCTWFFILFDSFLFTT